MPGIWAVVPAAGRGTRFGGEVPKQYLAAAGQPLIAHALAALLAHPAVEGAMVAISGNDPDWPGWTSFLDKPVLTCIGGATRARSVSAALDALPAQAAFSLEASFLHPQAAMGGLAAFTATSGFIDIGVPEDYARAQELFA